ncbi:MAG: hypothetical protein JWO80_6234 [Bryobacterales bacterium]|nr:hypothetical protein [Bryobacterales bacterium]
MHKTIVLLSAAFLLTVSPTLVKGQSFDTSGTANLTGQYFFRYVVFGTGTNGNVTEGCSVSGVMTFDGKGNYTTSNTQLYDSAGTTTGSCSAPSTGTYSVQSNGIAQIDNPIFSATLFGAFSQPVVTASSTEDGYEDLFVAIQAPTTTVSNNFLSGAYTLGTFDLFNGPNGLAQQGYFTVNADGNGNISTIALTGSIQNQSAATVTQSISGSTYSISGAGVGSLNVPASVSNQIVSGAKIFYVSADGNYVLGGSSTGSDLIFGFKAAAGTSSNSLLNGTYFIAGMDENVAQKFLDAFYGGINANGSGTLLWHERLDDVANAITYDNTFNSGVTIGANGSYNNGLYTTLIGVSGKAMMLLGSGQQFSLTIGVQAPSVTPPSGVWINPIGITNAANYTPITNSYAPGELVNIYGTFGVASQVDQAIPIPTTLGGVQVLVNGQAAPVYLVSANQISALIPYEVSGQFFATFQVVVNGTKSNAVSVYLANSAPGIYTLTQNGVGPGAILHSNYTVVSDSSPAMPGETVSLYMNGLGAVTPAVADGAAGPSSPLSNVSGTVAVFLDDGVDPLAQATVSFAGLAPGFPGLYQVNFVVPATGLGNGHVYISFQTNEATTEMSTISLAGFSHAAAQIAPGHRVSLGRGPVTSAPATHGLAAVKSRRRALAARPTER